MERGFDIVTIVSAVCVARYVAAAVGDDALHEFGLSGEAVRSGAEVADDRNRGCDRFLRKQFGKAK